MTQVFDADRPILTIEQDRLQRAYFAKYLARCMLDVSHPDSFVIGLYGGWGVGKTSILNMVTQELNFAATNLEDEVQPIILNFSAWSYSGQDQLIYSIFRRLSATLRAAPNLESGEHIIYLLELYISFFTKQEPPKILRKKTWWEKLTNQAPAYSYAWESGQDLTLVKQELNQLLKKQKRKIIIMIDNISRLYPQEIKQIFQSVKSIGDFCNTVYLLALDKHQVIQAINRLDGSGGEEYIEKIVQLPFEIPPIIQQDLEAIFAEKMRDVVAMVPEDAWQQDYWADVFYGSLRYFFDDCRDVTRYVNALNFSYSRLRDVVNPIDFFALTAIEVFSPNVYYGIRDNKDLFTDLLDRVYVLDDEQKQKDRIRCDEILSRTQHVSRDTMLELLLQLFPNLRRIYQPHKTFYYSDAAARKLKRICNPDLFDGYFKLSMHIGLLPLAEFVTIVGMADDKTAFDQALTRLNQDNQILKFLDMLDSKVIENIPRDHYQAIINALLDNGDLFPQGSYGKLSLDTPTRIYRIIHALLNQIGQKEERFILLQNAIAAMNKSLFIAVFILQTFAREHTEESDLIRPAEYQEVSLEQLHSLQKLCLNRIKYWAQTERLIDHPRLIAILHAWFNWGSEEECRSYVKTITDTDKGLISFLKSVLNEPINQVMMMNVKDPNWIKYLEIINNFIPPKSLEPHAKLLFEDNYFEKLREQEQLALMLFLDLVKSENIKMIPNTTV